jgi:hypothetical protein
MTRNMNKIGVTAAAILLMLVAGSCNDINRQAAPVALIVTNTQVLHQLDLAGDPTGETNCQQSIATVHMTTVLLQGPSSLPIPGTSPSDLNTVKVDRYRVSYVRVDGGNLVPAPFVRSISTTVGVGTTAEGTNFVAFDPSAIFQAPFAALLPQNGGRDPETGKSIITMDVILEVFGTTLAGERVSGNTRMTIDFCFSCGGCA